MMFDLKSIKEALQQGAIQQVIDDINDWIESITSETFVSDKSQLEQLLEYFWGSLQGF